MFILQSVVGLHSHFIDNFWNQTGSNPSKNASCYGHQTSQMSTQKSCTDFTGAG